MVSPRVLTAAIVTGLALLVVVVLVGLFRNDLDPTGVATVLVTMISGIVAGQALRGRSGGPPKGP